MGSTGSGPNLCGDEPQIVVDPATLLCPFGIDLFSGVSGKGEHR
jgi:hypothetical protein